MTIHAILCIVLVHLEDSIFCTLDTHRLLKSPHMLLMAQTRVLAVATVAWDTYIHVINNFIIVFLIVD